MKKILAVFFLLAVVVVVGCEPLHEDYGRGVFRNPQPLQVFDGGAFFGGRKHIYTVDDSVLHRYNIPVQDPRGRQSNAFLDIRRIYAREDSATTWTRPVEVTYKRVIYRDSTNVEYLLTGLGYIPRP